MPRMNASIAGGFFFHAACLCSVGPVTVCTNLNSSSSKRSARKRNACVRNRCPSKASRCFSYCSSDDEEVLRDSQINTIVIATRHNLHAQQVTAALKAGKHVFCEKPLCVSDEELQEISQTYHSSRSSDAKPLLMVGYNRRFAPMAIRMRDFLRETGEPLMMN